MKMYEDWDTQLPLLVDSYIRWKHSDPASSTALPQDTASTRFVVAVVRFSGE